jgi:hypothetical protein
VVKGTDVGTTTDADGNYTITVPIGATLVFSFVGMTTREILVTEDNLKPVKANSREGKDKKKISMTLQSIPRSLYKDSAQSGVGIAVLSEETPTYTSHPYSDPSTTRKITQRGRNYHLKTDSDPVRRTGRSIQFSTSFTIEQINKLPALQNEYAQGQSDGAGLRWYGADESEIFAWGPLLRTLEFDGSDYSLRSEWQAGIERIRKCEEAKNYNAGSFFKTGYTNANEIIIAIPARKYGTMIFDVENRTRSGVIPNSRYDKLNISTTLKNFYVAEGLTANGSFSYNRSRGNLLNRGSNFATIIGGVYRTPISFDNANGLSAKDARSSSTSYELADGSIRSTPWCG